MYLSPTIYSATILMNVGTLNRIGSFIAPLIHVLTLHLNCARIVFLDNERVNGWYLMH